MARYDITIDGNYLNIVDTENPDPNFQIITDKPSKDFVISRKYVGSTTYTFYYRNSEIDQLEGVEFTDFSLDGVDFTDQTAFDTWKNNNTGNFSNGGGNGNGVTFEEVNSFANPLVLDKYYRYKAPVTSPTTFELTYAGALDQILEVYITPEISGGGTFTLGSSFPTDIVNAVGTLTETATITLLWDGLSLAFYAVSDSTPVVVPNPPVVTSVVVENNARNLLKINLDVIVDVIDETDLSLSFTNGTPKTITSTPVIGSGTQVLFYELSADIEVGDIFSLVIGDSNNITNAISPNTNIDPITVLVTNNVVSGTQHRGLINTTSGSSTYVQDTMRAIPSQLQFFKTTNDNVRFVDLNNSAIAVDYTFAVGDVFTCVCEPQSGAFNPSPLFGGEGISSTVLGYDNFNRISTRSDQGTILFGGSIVRANGIIRSYRYTYVDSTTIQVDEGDANESGYTPVVTLSPVATDTYTLGHLNRASNSYCDTRMSKIIIHKSGDSPIVFNFDETGNVVDIYSTV